MGAAKEWITQREAARILGVGEVRARDVFDAGEVRRICLPGRVVPKYHRGDVLALLESSVSRGPRVAEEPATA